MLTQIALIAHRITFIERCGLPLFILLYALASSSHALADDDMGYQPVPEPPPLPARLQSGEVMDEIMESGVTIAPGRQAIIEEYRLNGWLYALKITPTVGPPYYLVDYDGDGDMETRFSELDKDFLIPQWVLFSW